MALFTGVRYQTPGCVPSLFQRAAYLELACVRHVKWTHVRKFCCKGNARPCRQQHYESSDSSPRRFSTVSMMAKVVGVLSLVDLSDRA